MFKVIEMGDKVNFVDSNNNFVGFDGRDECCAYGDWFISTKEHGDLPGKEEILHCKNHIQFPEHIFDESYFKKINEISSEYGCVIFKLVHEELDGNYLYLHLFNVHNGYYAKGFKCSFRVPVEGNI